MLAQKAIVIYAETAGAAHSFPLRPAVRARLPTAVEVAGERPGGKNKTGSETTEMQESGKERGRWRRALPLVKLPPAARRRRWRRRHPGEGKKKARQSVSRERRGEIVSRKVADKQTAAVKQLKTLIWSKM